MQRDRYLSVSLLNSNSPRYGSHTKLNSSHPCCGWWCKKRLSCIVLSQYVHTAFVYVSTRAGSLAGGPPRKVRKSRKFSITGVDSESPALLLSLVRTTATKVLGRGPSCRPPINPDAPPTSVTQFPSLGCRTEYRTSSKSPSYTIIVCCQPQYTHSHE